MKTKAGHVLTAQSRIRSLPARFIFTLVNFFIATYLAPSPWLGLWLGGSVIAQLVDRQIFANTLAKARRGAFERNRVRLIGSLIVVAFFLDIIVVYHWLYGGPTGRIIALLVMVCTLMHILFTLYYMRRYMYAAFSLHALTLVILPIHALWTDPDARRGETFAILILIMIALGAFVRGVRTFQKTISAQFASRASAHRARHQAEQALDAKFNFLATISHEIRTPMNAVVSSVHLLRQTRLDGTQKDYVNLLDQASEVLLGLVNDVLDLSRIEAGKMKLELSPVSLCDTLDALDALWQPQARAKGLVLRFETDPILAPAILSDSLRLKQILFNLVSNAVKFTPKGAITIRVVYERRHNDDYCRFEVRDEGVGIAPENLTRIFQGFEQADATTTRRYGGSGLGLTISRALARLMGGDLTVASVLGEGSTFSLSLPYRPAVMEAASADIMPAAHRKVLIVDDHEVNRRIVSLFIAPLGWSWSMACDGEEAVDISAREAFDVIVMDMQMPRMNGIDATRLIRTGHGPNRDTPVIALTANDGDIHQAAWAAVGVDVLIPKPVSPAKLIAVMTAQVRHTVVSA